MLRDTASMVTLPIAQPTASVGPTGSVRSPMPRLRITTIPKRTGSMPNFVMIGRKIGVQISNIGATSMKAPRNWSSRLISDRSGCSSSALAEPSPGEAGQRDRTR
jgi:hypothetical protein